MTATTRRGVLTVAAGTGAAVALAGCGGSSGSNSSSGAPAAGAGSAPASTAGTGAPGGTTLARTSDIPVGGGKVFPDRKVVVTQPTAGQFKAFTAICTHM